MSTIYDKLMRVHNELISIDGCYQPALPVALNCLQFNRVKKKKIIFMAEMMGLVSLELRIG